MLFKLVCYIYTNSKLKCCKTLQYSNFLLLVQSNPVNTDTEGAIHVESVRINRMSVLLSRLNLEKT